MLETPGLKSTLQKCRWNAAAHLRILATDLDM